MLSFVHLPKVVDAPIFPDVQSRGDGADETVEAPNLALSGPGTAPHVEVNGPQS